MERDSVEKLIHLVEVRPALYDKNTPAYNDKNVKDVLWGEICESVIQNWSNLSTEEQYRKCKDVQNRWANLRTCFTRELNAQRSDLSGQECKKRRKYIYFDNLRFLLPNVECKDTKHFNVECKVETILVEDLVNDEYVEYADDVDDIGLVNKEEIQHPVSVKIQKYKEQKPTHEETILDILNILQQNKNDEDIDEDKCFALSLVPILRKFNDQQKFKAKIEILQALNHIQNSKTIFKIRNNKKHIKRTR